MMKPDFYNYSGKRNMFHRFSNQLKLLIDAGILKNFPLEYKNTYVCPICLHQFNEDHLVVQPDNYLTEEHAPLNSLGGSKAILLCKKCNSEAGHKIDSHLLHYIQSLDFDKFYPSSANSVSIEFEGKRIQGDLEIDNNGVIKMHHKLLNNNPTLLDKFIYTIKNGFQLSVFPRLKKIDMRMVDLAILKMNYIMLFSKFGYILLDHHYDVVRNQIKDPASNYFPWSTYIRNQFSGNQIGTYYVTTEGLHSLFSVFALKTNYSETIIGSFLSIPKNPMGVLLENISSLRDSDDVVQFDTICFDSDINLFEDQKEIIRIIHWLKY